MDCHDDNTEVRFCVPEIPTPGFSDASRVIVYKRDSYGEGVFSPVNTTLDGLDIVVDGITSFSEFIMAGDVRLPIELTDFYAVADGREVTLSWTTNTEIDNAGFEVEHAVDLEEEFREIGFVEGRGSSVEPHRYTFRTSRLDPGPHYFRLKQIDFDGATAYSDVVDIVVALGQTFVLEPAYPIPFNPTATVGFAVATSQNVELTLYDLLGRQVKTPERSFERRVDRLATDH